MKSVFDIVLTWGCLFAGYAIMNQIKWHAIKRNSFTTNGTAFVIYAFLSATTVLAFETVPALLPHEGDESSYIFPIGFFLIGITLCSIGCFASKKRKHRTTK